MYDIHCHMLPGVDDGPGSLEDALAMASLARDHGTRLVVTTPHGAQAWALGGTGAMAERVEAFRRSLREQGNDLDVALGAEYFLEPELLQRLRNGDIISLNGSRYLLVEIDFLQYPPYTEELVFQLQVEGFVPVLAHPERQATIQSRPELLERLVERGVVTQITAGSLLGEFGRLAQKSAEELLKRNLVHVVASDGHFPSEQRLPVLSSGREALERLVGEEAATVMVVRNPGAVVSNDPLEIPSPRTPRRLFPRLGRRS